jgi:hypothetical protein
MGCIDSRDLKKLGILVLGFSRPQVVVPLALGWVCGKIRSWPGQDKHEMLLRRVETLRAFRY